MVTRDIVKVRRDGDNIRTQTYNYSAHEDFMSYKRNNLHKFLRNVLLYGVPSIFSEAEVGSASSSTGYIPVFEDGTRVYKERKLSEGTPITVTHIPHCQHLFSQICLESQGFVDKKWKPEGYKVFPAAYSQHDSVQKFFMNIGAALAMEVPVWGEDITGFIDLLTIYGGRLYILDYKPQCMQAKNKNAVAQLLKYVELLKALTGIQDIGAAYFDEKDTILLNI